MGNGRLKPAPEKLAAIRNIAAPTNLQQVQAFLGLVGFYRRFIKNFSGIARPLHELMRGGVPFEWTPKRQAAFESLRSALDETTEVFLP